MTSSEARSSDGDGARRSAPSVSIPLHEVLEEEFRRCHDEARTELDDASEVLDRPVPPPWWFTNDQILELADLARRLDGALRAEASRNEDATRLRSPAPLQPRDDAMALFLVRGTSEAPAGAELGDALTHYVRLEFPLDGAEATTLRTTLVARLNAVVSGAKHLLDLPGFDSTIADGRDAALITRAYELRATGQWGDMPLSQRLVLEAVFPTQLARLQDLRLRRIYERIRGAEHAALCLSGGGMRSATFSLGILQGLAREGLLGRFTYLSTVSGGGYVGGWLSAWMAHSGAEAVAQKLAAPTQARLEPEPDAIRHLRAFSNFLNPHSGLLSADTWTLAATILRNLVLTWLVLVPLLAAAVMIPWFAVAVLRTQPAHWAWLPPRYLIALLSIAGALTGVKGVSYVHGTRPNTHQSSKPADVAAQRDFLVHGLLPIVLSAVLFTTAVMLWWEWFGSTSALPWLSLWIVIAAAVLHLIGWSLATQAPWRQLRDALSVSASGILAGLATAGVVYWLLPESRAQHGALLHQSYPAYVVLAMPAFLALLLLASQLYVGLRSRLSDDPSREWNARFNAWLLIVIAGWMIMSGVILYGPLLVRTGAQRITLLGVGGVAGWITVLLGGSARTTGAAPESASTARRVFELALKYAAPIFSVAIVIGLSMLDLGLVSLLCRYATSACDQTRPGIVLDVQERLLPSGLLIVTLALLTLGYAAGSRIDTNRFSLHALYRARLIRAFLGASRPAAERHPDGFTGFDEHDNLLMRDLWPATRTAEVSPGEGRRKPPLHVINMALNLVAGRNLAWQERKAESFTVTALHAGAPMLGYRRTSVPPDDPTNTRLYGGPDGISLGSAMTVSGAAASPNAGSHSSPLVTFLMTLFNARLGIWLGNPGPAGRGTFTRHAPRAPVQPILSEMFGLTSDRSPYVFLSDGGHFENLGLYEMVLRRCRFIVVSDASCDPTCSFEDLGNAIRKIRIDMGIPIEFPEGLPIRARGGADKRTSSGRYSAVGTIRYSCVDRDPSRPDLDDREYDGVLIYIKPAFYGREPRDVYNYAMGSPTFPHETTNDQFYGESQFESYRALGSYIVEEICRDLPTAHDKYSARSASGTLWWLAQRARYAAAAGVRTAATH